MGKMVFVILVFALAGCGTQPESVWVVNPVTSLPHPDCVRITGEVVNPGPGDPITLHTDVCPPGALADVGRGTPTVGWVRQTGKPRPSSGARIIEIRLLGRDDGQQSPIALVPLGP